MRRLRRGLCPQIQPGKILPRLRRTHEENQSRRAKAETKAEMSRFRAFQTRINQGFFSWVSKGTRYIYPFPPGNSVLNAYKPSKSTRTQGGDPIADYIMADTKLPPYLPYPRFLLKMEISQTAKLLYALLLDRSPSPRRTSGRTARAGFILSIPSRR